MFVLDGVVDFAVVVGGAGVVVGGVIVGGAVITPLILSIAIADIFVTAGIFLFSC